MNYISDISQEKAMKPTKEHYAAYQKAKDELNSVKSFLKSIPETADGFIAAGFDPRRIGRAEGSVHSALMDVKAALKKLDKAHGQLAKARNEEIAARSDGADPIPDIPVT